jgi:membrane-bound lytic murein transglycosylase MltF
VAPEAQYPTEKVEFVQHVEQSSKQSKIVSIQAGTEVKENFALESIPYVDVEDRLSNIFRISPQLSEKIVDSAGRNAYSDFPSRNDILAIIAVESNFNPKAYHKGSVGLMQIEKRSHRKLISGKYLYDIDANIKAGSVILHQYFITLGNDKKAAILAYNAGIGNYLRRRFKIEYYKKYLSKLSLISKIK